MSRASHKAYIKSKLEEISFEGTSISVDTHYNAMSAVDPYIFIQSQGVTMPLLDNKTYDLKYEYTVTYIFQIIPDQDDPMQEIRSDELEHLMLAKLRSEEVRDNNTDDNWIDLSVTDVSAPFQPDDSGQDGRIAKTITFEVFAVEALS